MRLSSSRPAVEASGRTPRHIARQINSMNKAFFKPITFAVLFTAICSASAPAMADPHAVAVLQSLDKVTARVSTVTVPVGRTAKFGTLFIKVYKCDKRPPEETPESAAFLDITERNTDGQSVRVFTGWMFASSPALNALEHPVYDVWVINCKEPIEPAN